MVARSDKTFQEERDSFRNVDRIFWESEREYPFDPIAGILEELNDHNSVGRDYVEPRPAWMGETPEEAPQGTKPLGRTGLWILGRGNVVNKIGKAAGKSNEDFANSFWNLLGVDIEGELEKLAHGDSQADEGALQAMTATFGTDAFGTYCPWHAFGNSGETPWGLYMFLEKLLEWASALHSSGRFLPQPKPPVLKVLQFLWLATYRHELFHFHVELYATRLESALRRPVYRPYVEHVRSIVAQTPMWWEEALAQAVVLTSKMVKRILGIDSAYMNRYVTPYFRTFPEGYKRFECRDAGGVEAAHRILSAQIARTQVTIGEAERNTGLSLAKSEYRIPDDSVPGYLVLRPNSWTRFQLQTPRLRDVVRFLQSVGEVNEYAPGDHKRAMVNGQVSTSTELRRATRLTLHPRKL